MKNLTEYYKILLLIHKNKREKAMTFIFTNSQTIENLHPLIEQTEEFQNLEYSLKFKSIQKSLIKDIKDFLYFKDNTIDIVLKIVETNNILQKYKDTRYTDNPIQALLNIRISEIINIYIKHNLIILSYIKDLLVLSNMKIKTILEKAEIDMISKKIHKILVHQDILVYI